jgi:hypothetical protein
VSPGRPPHSPDGAIGHGICDADNAVRRDPTPTTGHVDHGTAAFTAREACVPEGRPMEQHALAAFEITDYLYVSEFGKLNMLGDAPKLLDESFVTAANLEGHW